MEIVFSLKFSYFLSKNRGKFEFFMIARKISKSVNQTSLVFFANGRRKLLHEVVTEVTG